MTAPQPPKAKQKRQVLEAHGQVREDHFYWLREKDDPETIQYLEAENRYAEAAMADTKDLQEKLFAELKGRTKETDRSAPVRIDDYYYYARTEAGKEYLIYCRKKDSLENEEEVLLDQNELANQSKFCGLGVFRVSPDHALLAYSVDVTGSEQFTVYVKDLATGKLLPDEIANTGHSLEWKNDSASFIYTTLDATLRPYRAMLHTLGQPADDDTELYQEADERFFMGLSKSKSDKYIFVGLGSKITSEEHFLDADAADATLTCVQPREQGHEYSVEHHEDTFYISSNEHAPNFKLMKAPVAAPGKENWEEIIAHRDDVFLDMFEVFKRHLCVYELAEGVVRVRVRDLANDAEHYVDFPEEVYEVDSATNPVFDTSLVRLVYSSLVTPQTVFDYDMDTKERTVVKEQEVFGGYDPDNYVVRRLFAATSDGTNIPISLAHRKDIPLDGSAPCWLSGYGAYGMVHPVHFSPNMVSLLDRGFVVAVAHIRGGGERGRQWYEDGKYLQKGNTFTDYITAAEYLVDQGYTSPDRLVACGRSAGGLLMGAVANMRPDLFAAIVTSVPFVDAVTTMLDPSIPLTVIEYEEWGNPNEKEYFDYMISYSPYDNITQQDYPHILVMTGLHDSRVQYWEPAKWVAKLRTMKTDENLLILRTEMEQGHGGASGRYEHLREIAFEFTFVLKVLGLIERES